MKPDRLRTTLRALLCLAVAVFTSLLLTTGVGRVVAAPTSATDLPQVTAEPPLRVPGTASCTETVLVHTFANSYYSPGYGQHKASACPGPWSFVAMTTTVSTSGVQFDRLFDIYIGHVPLLSSSTSEPASEVPGAITHWQVNTDVSRFATLLASDQPITAILNNVNDSTYTGQYAVTLKLTYYAVGASVPAISAPDYVGAVFNPGVAPHQDGPGDYGTSGYANLTASSPSFTKALTLPRNLLTLSADVYAEGHGACEEFWWADPGQCGVGTPLRQAVLSIDGVVAGFAPVYPVLFTGGGGPGSWEPIPSPRAWHLDPYRLDLTPFIGRLVDGQPHSFRLDIPDAAYSDGGDYWVVGATLLGTTDKGLAQTSGALTSAPVAAAATTTSTTDPTSSVLVFSGSRDASWTGYVTGSTGRAGTTVTNHFDIASRSAALVNSTWHWNTSSAVTAGTAAAVTTAQTHTYTLSSAGAGPGTFGDAATTTVSGPTPFNSAYNLQLVTAGAVYANATEAETYAGTDSGGYCYQRAINTASGYILSDQTTPACVAGTTLSGGSAASGSTSSGGSGGAADSSLPPRCTVPGPTLGTDAVGDETTKQSSQDIVSVSAAEPYVTTGSPLIAFHIKVSDLKTLVPGTAYYTSFYGADGKTVYGARMTVPASGAPTFISYTASPSGGTTPVTDGRFVGTATAAEAASNYVAASGDIYIYVKPASLGLTAAGQTLSGFNGGVVQNSDVAGTGVNAAAYLVDGLPDDLDRMGTATFTYADNAACAPNSPPVAKLAADKTSGDKPLTVNFSGTGSTDPDMTTGDKVANYAFDFGDGTMTSNTTGTATHTYAKSGTYTASLGVTDTHGAASGTASTLSITAVNEAPTVTLAASPAAPAPNQAVTFTATGTDANADDAKALTYSFDLDGDGKYEVDYGTANTQQKTYAAAGTYTVNVLVKDLEGKTGTGTVTVTVADPTLDAFTFAERKDVDLGTVITSEAVTLSGTAGASFPISVSGGTNSQYSLNGGAFTSDAGTVKTGDKLVVRHTSSASNATAVTTTVTVGKYATTFKSTTKAASADTKDHVPDAFDFGETDGVNPGQVYTSAAVTPVNYDDAPVIPSQVSYSINGGPFTTARGTISKGQSIRVQMTSSKASLGYAKGYVTIGGVKGTYTLRTRK